MGLRFHTPENTYNCAGTWHASGERAACCIPEAKGCKNLAPDEAPTPVGEQRNSGSVAFPDEPWQSYTKRRTLWFKAGGGRGSRRGVGALLKLYTPESGELVTVKVHTS